MSTPASDPSRRSFLRQACCAAVGSTSILSTLAQLRAIGAVAADASSIPHRAAALPADYKALVCLFLNGGNDGNSMIVPRDAASHADYAKARGDLTIPQAQLIPLALQRYNDGRSYGLHPAMSGVAGLFNQGKAAVIGNVGTLVEPTTLAQYKLGRGLPRQLYSHSDQVTQWQSSIPDRPSNTGWGGRMGDLVNAMNTNGKISMAISLNGVNTFEMGRTVSGYSVYYGGATTFNASSTQARETLRTIAGSAQTNLISAAFGSLTQGAMRDSELLAEALRTTPAPQTVFPTTNTGLRLGMIARLIAAAPAFNLKRQIFFVQLGGWDLHGGQIDGHGPLLEEISGAMTAFYDATVELGVAHQVTTFTASEFGRSYTPNAGGTDHGWGNHQLVMGGAVKGGDIYGQMPSLAINGADDTGRGRWIPSTSVDEYHATLATWFGVGAGDLATVLPNIGRFGKTNLGFLV